MPEDDARPAPDRDGRLTALETVRKRRLRLLGQPLLLAWALWATRTSR